jgi:hypothetical protein
MDSDIVEGMIMINVNRTYLMVPKVVHLLLISSTVKQVK